MRSMNVREANDFFFQNLRLTFSQHFGQTMVEIQWGTKRRDVIYGVIIVIILFGSPAPQVDPAHEMQHPSLWQEAWGSLPWLMDPELWERGGLLHVWAFLREVFFDWMEDCYVVFELLLLNFRRLFYFASIKLSRRYHQDDIEVRSKVTSNAISYLPQESG